MGVIKLGHRGDTIIEVLIAVVVVGLAIGLAYGTASRSLRLNRQAQERGEALKKVEGQIERLKSIAANKTTENSVFISTPYCIADTPAPNTVTGISPVPALSADPLTPAAYGNGACVDGRYHLSIVPNDGVNDQFSVSARWEGLSGKKEEVNVKYRLHKKKTTNTP